MIPMMKTAEKAAERLVMTRFHPCRSKGGSSCKPEKGSEDIEIPVGLSLERTVIVSRVPEVCGTSHLLLVQGAFPGSHPFIDARRR